MHRVNQGIDTIATKVHRARGTIVRPSEHGSAPTLETYIMKIFAPRTIFAMASLTVLFMGTASAERSEVSGDVFYTLSKRTAAVIPHNTGQAVSITESTGSLKQKSGSNRALDGAQVTSVGAADVTNGNGEGKSWGTFTQPGGSANIQALSQIKTTVGAEGKTVTTVTGKYELVGGTGSLANLKGAGEFTVDTTSPTTQTLHYTGWLDQPQ